MANYNKAREFLSSRQNAANDFAESRGVDRWTTFSYDMQKQADDFGKYLNSGKYTTADTDKYRSSANKAVEDLTAEMGRYGKNTQQYKTLDSYRQYYQDSLGTFDRIDVGTKMQDYINDYDTWRTQEDYDLQKQSLQASLAALDAEMEKIEDKNSADYKSLKSWRDWYASYEDGLNRRAERDSYFDDVDDYTAYKNSTDYKHVADVKNTYSTKLDEIKAIDPKILEMDTKQLQKYIKSLESDYVGLQAYGGSLEDVQALGDKITKLNELVANNDLDNLKAMQTEIQRLDQYGVENIQRNYGGAYNPNIDYQAKIDELNAALEKAKDDPVKSEEISAQIRAIAGVNGDGTNENGLYDEHTWLGRQIMENFDVEAAQKRIDEIDKELEDRGLTTSRFWAAVMKPGENEFNMDYNPDGSSTGQYAGVYAESDPEVIALRQEKTELTQKINSSERQKGRSKIETANAELPEIDGAFGKGNIDLTKRNTGLKDADGNLMTVKSMSFEEDGKEILIPTVVKKNGKWVELSEDEAIDWYHKTGEYLGKFDSVEEADKYAEALHRQQEDMYVNGKTKTGVSKSTLIEAGKGQLDNTKEFYSGPNGVKNIGRAFAELEGEFDDSETGKYYAARAQELLDIVYAAMGAEKLGIDIGYSVEEALKAYEAQINDIAGYRRAAEVNASKTDFGRWNKQMFGRGGLVGGAISNLENLPGLFTDEYRPPSVTQSQIAHTGEMMGDQYDNINMPGDRNLAQTLHEAAVTTGNMLPSIGLSAAVTALAGPAGLSTAAAGIAGQLAGAFEMGLASGGQSYQQMLGMGYDMADARAYGILMGTAEAGTQYLLGGIGKLGGVSEDALLGLTKKIGNGIVRGLADTAIHNVSEISEELLQNRIERYMQYALFDQGGPDFMSWTEDDWYTVVVTALSTTAMEGPGVAINSYKTNQLGLLASGQKTYSEAKTKGLMSAKLNKQEKARRALASEIGKAMKGDEALSYTLKAIGSSMDEGTNARELADLMDSGKIPANSRNLGELFGAILSETTDADGKVDFDKFMAQTIGGAIKFNEIKRAERAEGDTEKALNDAGQTLEEVMKNNPGAAVLNKTASALSTQYGADPVKAVDTAAVINKIRNGTAISSREMEQITGNSAEAKAARAYLAQQTGGENISVTADAAVTEAMVNGLIKTNREQKKLVAEQTKAEVLAAATEAGDAAEVNRAAAGAVTKITAEDVKALQGAKRGVQEAERAAEIAKTRKQTVNDMSFEQMAERGQTLEGAILMPADAQMVDDLKAKNAELQKTIDELSAVKMPSRAQSSQLASAREQLAENNARIETIMKGAADRIAKERAEAQAAEAESKKAEEKTEEKPKKKGKKGIPPKQKKGEETVTLPSGNTMTRSEFNGTDEEWNNMVAQSGGSVMEESNEQTTDNDQGRNALGGSEDRGADQERGDRPEQGSDAGGDRSRRKLSTFDGSREVEINEEVDSDATITRNDDVSGLEESHPGIREFTDSLMSAGFKRITYVSNGNLYNIEGEAVPGFYNNGELFLSLDPHPGWAGYEATAEHEKLHLKLALYYQHLGKDMTAEQAREEVDNFISATIQNIIGEASYIDAFRKYWKRYSPVYLRNNDIQTVAHMVNEEMLCDMIGGIDNFDAALGRYQDSLQDILNASHFNSVADALANRPDENPGTVTTEALDPGAMPHNVPVDTLISSENVDTPSTLPADPGNVSKLAFYGLASALGFKVDETHPKSKVYYLNDEDARLGRNGFTQITVDMIKASPIGNMIRYAQDKGYITEDQAEQEYNLFASIGSISDQTHDFYQAMQFMGSTIFTALKMNSDPQYGTTYDFPSICTKTQAVIDDMSAQMVSLKRALTEDEIIEIYQRQFTAGNPVPCPECYVFSRWVGIGGLLDNINYYQDTYGSMTPEEVARIYEENAEKVAKAAEAAGVNFGKQKSKMAAELQKKYNDLKEKREKAESVGKAVSKKAIADEEALRRQMSDIRSLSWIDNVYFGGKAHLAKNVNKNFRVPTEILFDLNEGETFARDYKEAWAFRTTQGAGYGKAITPYAEAILGEGIQITKGNGAIKLKADGKLDHVFLSETGEITDKSERGKTLKAAIKKQLNQLFIGGQRFQSTSDARFDNAVDYLLAGLEMQTMHGGVQVYTKVPGAVHFFNLLGMCTNMSLMPKGSGLDENGVPVDTTTGGMNPETAMMLRIGNEYAGTITIGVNDAHIRAMFNQAFRDFIIPYHASGGKAALISEFRRIQEGKAVGEGEMPQSTDYTNTQTDKFVTDEILRNDLGYTEAEIEDVRKFRATRIYILTNGSKRVKNNTFYREMLDTSAEGLTESQINARRILQQLYVSMQEGGDWHGVELSKGLVEGQIFPNEFWDTSVSYEESGVNTQRYLDYCKALGVLHRFSGKGVKTGNVTNKDGTVTRRGYVYNVTGRDQHGNEVALTDLAYKNGKDGEIEPFFWKTLTDRRMYGNQGQYLKQPRVDLTNLKAEDVATFAAPMGERRYNRRDALRVAAQPLQSSQSRMSLQNLDYAVEPSTDKWQRDHTTEEVKAMYPDLWDITADESETRNPTQVRDTVKTYRKIYDILKAENFDGKILDASSGLGDGTRAGREEYGFDVEDIEPYPDKNYSPTYTDYDSLNKKYDAIISNAVLNVLPQDQRDALVVKMGELLNPGGKMYINVRGDDVRGNKSNKPVGGKWEYYVASTGSYQKGFTKPELKAYLEDALGDGFTVRITNDFGKTAAIVTKDSGKPSAAKPTIPAKNAPKKQTAKTEKPTAEPRFSIQGEPATAQQAQTYYSQQDAKVNDWAPEFYSKMQRTIEDWTGGNGKPMGAKMAANQVLSWLKGKGVKAEEIKWSGIIPYLEGKKTVTKDELLQVMAENEIKIETKVLESGAGFKFWSDRDWEEVTVDSLEDLYEYAYFLADEEGIDPEEIKLYPSDNGYYIMRDDTGEIMVVVTRNDAGDTRWSEYKTDLQEGFNYREILFKQPGLDYTNQAMQVHWGSEDQDGAKAEGKDVIAHARVQDTLTENDVPTIFVEEIQSDLHNAGTTKQTPENTRGFTREHAAPGFADKLQREYQRYMDIMDRRDLTPAEQSRLDWITEQLAPERLTPAREAYTQAMDQRRTFDADLDQVVAEIKERTKEFQQLGLIRGKDKEIRDWVTASNPRGAFRYADESFLDSLMGDSVNEPYRFPEELVTRIKSIRAAYQASRDASEDLIAANRGLSMAPPDVPFAGSADTYHEYVMKHLLRLAAEGGYARLAWTTAQQQSDRWSDEYAEGYKIEYDQNIPKFMNKYVKQWGGKVGTTVLDNGDEVWSVDITPEMRDSVLTKGQPLFSIQGNDSSVNSLYPEGTLQRDILDVLQTEGSEGLTAWVNEQKAKHEDALENAKIKAPSIPSKGFVPPVSAKERALQRSTLEALINRYGTMKPSEKSNGFVLPPKNQKGQPLRRHIQNVLSSENISDEARDHGLRFTLTNANATFVPDSDEALIKDAKADIDEMGLEHALASFKRDASKVKLGTKGILQNIALGEQLLLETSSNGDMANFVDVLSSVCELGTTIGKSLQAFRLLKQSGPIGQLYYVQKAVDRMNKQNEERMKRKGEFKEIIVKDDLAKAVINAKTEEDRDAAMDALIADIASQAPVTLRDRWNAWRYLAMLGNARTHVRNIVGNAFFAPMRYVKDVMAAGGEFLATKAGLMEEEDRTKALTVSRELRDFALEDADVMQKELQGNGKYNPAQEILQARKLLPGFLNTLSKANGNALEMEDWWFLRGAYARALSQQLSHMGYTTEQLTTTTEGQEALNRARKNAILEAQKATYRDFVAAASWLNRGKHLTGPAGTILSIGLEGVLPFTKTPINILRRGVEYSPIGFAAGIGKVLSGLKNGNLDVAEAIDQMAAGLTGTGVAVLGLLLARMGVLRGKKGDDDEENFDKMQGMQDYSLQLGDQSFTIDWAAPTALPLFTGAAVAQLLEESGEDGLQAKDIWNGIMMIAEPMTSLSMLDGLNKLIESTAYASGNEKIATIATQAATSYLGQAFPTILGQVARSIDGTRRSTYVDKNSPIPAAAQRFVQSSVQAKIPGWENAKVPYIDAWGRTSEPSSKVLNGIENFFAPWYRNVKQVTDVDEELRRLNDEVGEVLPKTPEKSFKVDGKNKFLTPDEWVSFATDVGQTKYDLMTQMISDPRYLALTDAQKKSVIKEYVYKYSLAAGKFHIAPEYDIRKNGAVWIQEAEAAATDYARFERIWEAIEKGLKL